MNPRTIGILVTNTDHSAFAQSWPRDGEKFSILLKSVRPDWALNVYDCTQDEFPEAINACDGYVIGGSPASVNHADAWISKLFDFIRQLHTSKKLTVGCCFGHQAIAKALGGTVVSNPKGWGFGVAPTHFSTAETWMIPASATLKLFAAHNEQVDSLPEGARILGGDDFCPAASLAVGEHFLTTQYHPEMSKAFFVALAKAFEKYIGPAVVEKALRQAQATEAQAAIFAEWMARFLERA